MSIWWSLHLRREAASVPLARRLLMGTMESAGVHPDVSYDLSLALTEACANAVEHGGAAPSDAPGGDSPGGAYRVTAYLDGEKCRIEVADSGPGFPPSRVHVSTHRRGRRRTRRPAPAPAPALALPPETSESGRGLCLIRELADHVDFGSTPGRGGAVISFDKILKWREDAPLVTA
ncbi:ATP-binding protein [Streptomyces silvensis]|uniref:ATP-binding protein n=1 Tax=Streptomyces silvensis TaxID=1765722 RepID=A0A0W7WYT3_9ACTN|nr:ATP-binding protein [Streptomyces silvensis]KUF15726.1 ATP-binding protein [Streptomyces silvensis]